MSAIEPSVNSQTAVPPLTVHVEAVGSWSQKHKLRDSAPESQITYFTPDNRKTQQHQVVTLKNETLRLKHRPKVLQATFDTHFHSIPGRATAKLNSLKALSGTNSGPQKQILIVTYNVLVCAFIAYTGQLWCLTLRTLTSKSYKLTKRFHCESKPALLEKVRGTLLHGNKTPTNKE